MTAGQVELEVEDGGVQEREICIDARGSCGCHWHGYEVLGCGEKVLDFLCVFFIARSLARTRNGVVSGRLAGADQWLFLRKME